MSFAGRLLVATPMIADPNFERTVVLILAHGADGSFGLVLNRPSQLPVAGVAERWAPLAEAPGVVFVGGPVGRDEVVGLGRPEGVVPGAPVFAGGCTTVDLANGPDSSIATWSTVRLFAGSSGWAAGQLEDELAEGSWWVADAVGDDLLTSGPDELWTRVLHRQPGELAWFANHPTDPSAN